MVGGYNKGGYLGRHEEPRCYGPQQQPWSRPILEATRDRGCRRVPGLRMFKLRWDQPAGCRLVRSRQFSPNAACGQRAAKFSACFLFRRESCFILALPEAFYLPRTEVLGIPTGELNHEGCSRKGLLCGRWLEAGPRGSRLLGEGHEMFSLVRSLSCIWPLCVPCMAGAPSLSLVYFLLAHTGMLLHNEVCLVFSDRGTCTLLRP